jgi:hypothetical protein
VDLKQLGQGAMIAGGAGVALLLVMFMPWYDAPAGVEDFTGSGGGVSAWSAFGLIDLVLFATAATAITVAVLAAQGRSGSLPVPDGVLLLGAGALASALVVFRILSVPGNDDALLGAEVDRAIGLFLGLVCTLAIAYAGTVFAEDEDEPPPTRTP